MLLRSQCFLLVLFLMRGLPLYAGTFVPPPTYSAEAIEAWVVDEDTGQPLEGVIVIAHWELMGGIHPDEIGQLMIMETVTDASGRFFFPAWGPKVRPLEGFLHNDDPELLLFKSGYKFLSLANRLTEEVNTSALRRSDWNGQTVKLKKFTGTMQEYARHLGSLTISVESITQGEDCEWKQVPRLLVALDQQEKLFEGRGFYYDLPFIDHLPDQDKCGSAREYFRSYLT